jgi:hypothetical protein
MWSAVLTVIVYLNCDAFCELMPCNREGDGERDGASTFHPQASVDLQ